MHVFLERSALSHDLRETEKQSALKMLAEGVRARSAVLKCAAHPSSVTVGLHLIMLHRCMSTQAYFTFYAERKAAPSQDTCVSARHMARQAKLADAQQTTGTEGVVEHTFRKVVLPTSCLGLDAVIHVTSVIQYTR
jgi:hypothetical protein